MIPTCICADISNKIWSRVLAGIWGGGGGGGGGGGIESSFLGKAFDISIKSGKMPYSIQREHAKKHVILRYFIQKIQTSP